MKQSKVIEYMLINEKARYEAFRAITVAVRNILITLLLCATLIFCAYMYFVVPVEEVEVDNGSHAVLNTTVDNGSQVWQ